MLRAQRPQRAKSLRNRAYISSLYSSWNRRESSGKAYANHELPSTSPTVLPPLSRFCCMGTVLRGGVRGVLERGSMVPPQSLGRYPRRRAAEDDLAPRRGTRGGVPDRWVRALLDARAPQWGEPLDRVRLAQRPLSKTRNG